MHCLSAVLVKRSFQVLHALRVDKGLVEIGHRGMDRRDDDWFFLERRDSAVHNAELRLRRDQAVLTEQTR